MHAFILFFWLTNHATLGVHSQEFKSKTSCIKAGVTLKKSATEEITFMCIEK